MADPNQELQGIIGRLERRDTLNWPGPTPRLRAAAATSELGKLTLDSPSAAAMLGPGQPNNNNTAGGLGSDDPQVSEETTDDWLVRLQREWVEEGGVAKEGGEVEMGETDGSGGEERAVVVAKKVLRGEGVKRGRGGPGVNYSNPASGYSRWR